MSKHPVFLLSLIRLSKWDAKNYSFSSSIHLKELQRALSECDHLECLKLESEKSPYIDWHNSRYSKITSVVVSVVFFFPCGRDLVEIYHTYAPTHTNHNAQTQSPYSI